MIRLLLPLLLSASASLASAGDIAWSADLHAAQTAATASNGVVFVAVNMDGERANDRLAKDVYHDKTILALTARTQNVIASNFEHAAKGKTCPRFKTITCEQHRAMDIAVRSEILAPDEKGRVVAPQHVFLGPDGKVIFSVPYEVKASELEWCFVHALRTVNPDIDLEISSRARPPKRLIAGSVYQLGAEVSESPLSREEALLIIKEIKKGLHRGAALENAAFRLVMADEPEARDYAHQLLNIAKGGGRGGKSNQREAKRAEFLHHIGRHAAVSYWEVCIEYIDATDPVTRSEAIVAVEQLGSRDALKSLLSRFRKEKDESIAKNILRAIGTCAEDDKNARKLLIKHAKSDRSPVLQVNAMLSLGWLSEHEDIREVLIACLPGDDVDLARAAVISMAISRDNSWKAVLEEQLDGAATGTYKQSVELALSILNGAPISNLAAEVEELGVDAILRERIFGKGKR